MSRILEFTENELLGMYLLVHVGTDLLKSCIDWTSYSHWSKICDCMTIFVDTKSNWFLLISVSVFLWCREMEDKISHFTMGNLRTLQVCGIYSYTRWIVIKGLSPEVFPLHRCSKIEFSFNQRSGFAVEVYSNTPQPFSAILWWCQMKFQLKKKQKGLDRCPKDIAFESCLLVFLFLGWRVLIENAVATSSGKMLMNTSWPSLLLW